MSDFDKELDNEALTVHYSRRHRKETLAQTQQLSLETELSDETEIDEVVEARLRWPHYVSYALLSLMVSASTVVLPYLSMFANGLQVQHLYTGTAMTYGQLPYTHLFATGGFLYYVIIALLSHFGASLALVAVQWLSLFVAGIYFEKSLIRLTNRDDLGQGLTVIFYLLQLALGFGGLYPIQWATPFVLMGFYYLTSYFAGQTKDEIFIAYGLFAGLSVLLDPKTLLFWLWALLFLGIYNLSHKRWARGFYQFLALSFGLAFVIYIALYFMLNLQVLAAAMRQSVLFPLLVPAFELEDLWLSLGFQLGGLLLTGLLTGWLGFYGIVKGEKLAKWSYWLLFFVTLSYSGFALVSQTLWLYPLLYVLPFALLLTGAWLVKRDEERRPNLFSRFIIKQAVIPFLAIVVAIAYPIGRGFLEKPLNQERAQVVAYLNKQTEAEDKVYVWDKTSLISLKAGRRSASQLSSPAIYTAHQSQLKRLEDEWLQHKANYLVVNKDMPLTELLAKDLDEHYQEVSGTDFSHFTIYRLK